MNPLDVASIMILGGAILATALFLYYWWVRPRLLKRPRLTRTQFRKAIWAMSISFSMTIGGLILLIILMITASNSWRWSDDGPIMFCCISGLILLAVYQIKRLIHQMQLDGLVE